MSKRRRTTQKIHVADALVSIVVGRDGMADIRCGRDVEPEYLGAYLTELARRFNANEPGAPLAHSETCIVTIDDLRLLVALANTVDDVTEEEAAALNRARFRTYALDPSFYGATYCIGCRMHRPVGAHGEFLWLGTEQRVGTRADGGAS